MSEVFNKNNAPRAQAHKALLFCISHFLKPTYRVGYNYE